jgi:peptide/nickel transport system ATP-binding protein
MSRPDVAAAAGAGSPADAGGVNGLANVALTVRDLQVSAGGLSLISDVSFTLAPGERVGLIGESGSGKSLTALAIMGLLPEELRAGGSVRLVGAGFDLVGAGERSLSGIRGNDMAMVFQEPMTALNPVMRVGDQVSEVMLIHGRQPDRPAARRAAVEMLGRFQLPDPEQTARAYPHQLSGGQRQRVVLAIALANDPAVVLCDEPTTALDVTVQAHMLELILSGTAERDAALLFITHDLAVVASVCERVMVMYGGRIVEAGPIEEVLTRPRHPYTRGLLDASDLEQVDDAGRLRTIPGTVPAAGRFPSGCVFRNRCPLATEQCEQQPPDTREGTGAEVAAGSGGRTYACWHPLDQGSTSSTVHDHGDLEGVSTPQLPMIMGPAGEGNVPVLRVRDLHRVYRRPRTSLFGPRSEVRAVNGVSFDVWPGRRFGLVGESGSGKSTLIRLLAALDHPTSGSIEFDGQEIADQPERGLRFLRQRLQVVFQDPMSSLDPRMRVRDIIAEPLVAQHQRSWRTPGRLNDPNPPPPGGSAMGSPDVADRVRELLAAVGLPDDSGERYPHQFSGGQRQRISIARALSTRPDVLVADEPVSALDVSVRGQILNLLADLVDEYALTLVFVSHDLSVVRHVCDTIAVMYHGQLVEVGPTERIYHQPEHAYTQRLVAAVPTLHRALAGVGAAELAHAVAAAGADPTDTEEDEISDRQLR